MRAASGAQRQLELEVRQQALVRPHSPAWQALPAQVQRQVSVQ